jgi:hypothetical protein
MLHLILYEVPHCDFHHIDGDLQLVPLEHWTDLGGYIFMEPFLFMALDYLMEVFGWGSLTSPWLDDYACWFGGLLTCACLVDHPLVAHLMVMEHAISSWCGFGILVYLGCATSCSWMMVLAPQGVR